MNKDRADRIAFGAMLAGLLLLAVIYGFFSAKLKIFPYGPLNAAFSAVSSIATSTGHHLFPVRHEKPGVTVYKPDLVSPGVTLLTTYWRDYDWGPGVRLIETSGEVLHHWDIDPTELWPESPYDDLAAGSKNVPDNYVHGTWLLDGGDLIFNIEYLGLFRVDSCGEVKWKLPFRTHHSVYRSGDGTFWVSGQRWIMPDDPEAEKFSALFAPFSEDVALNVSADGEILKEISMLDALHEADRMHLFPANVLNQGDILHLNDVEILEPELADDFPMFEAGDMVVSLKYIDTVAVLGPDGAIKWIDAQSFLEQHDPDFEPGGWITVFDNRTDGTELGDRLGGTRITSIRPDTGERRHLFPTDKTKGAFYTAAGGKHQRLPNGNRLIVEARAGRAVEVTPAGEIIWQWVQEPYERTRVPEVLEANRYPFTADTVADWKCSR